MIVQFLNVDSTGHATPKRIANFGCWTVIYLQVKSPGTLLLAATEQALTVTQGNYQNGLEISSNDGIQKMQWIGDLYGLAKDAQPVSADFEFPGMNR